MVERMPTPGFRSTTRPENRLTNRTLKNAALQTLTLAKSPRSDNIEELLSDRSGRTAQSTSLALKENLAIGTPRSQRVAPPKYRMMGEYRPHVPPLGKAWQCANPEFQQMLEMIGEKVRQKFSKARDVFRFVDTDRSGTISRGEVHYFFRFFNVDTVLADKFFDGFETNEEGEIAYVEFVRYLWPHINPGNEQAHWALKQEADKYQKSAVPKDIYAERSVVEEIKLPTELVRARINIAGRLELKYKNKKEAFRDLDYNRDGDVTQAEMHRFFRIYGWEDVADRFYDVLCQYGNGHVRFDTFASLFTLTKDTDFNSRV